MKVKMALLLSLLWLSSILSSCKSLQATISIEDVAPTSSTPSRLPSSTPIYTPTSSSNLSRYSIECIEIYDAIPPELTLEGILALDSFIEGESSYLLNLTTGRKITIGNTLPSNMVISPDRTLLAYWDIGRNAVIITDPSGVDLKVIPDPDERYTPSQWVTKDRLALGYRRREWNDPFTLESLIIMNPFTGEQREFLPDLPNINNILNAISWSDYFGSRMVPNSSVSYFVYPASEDGGMALILWDIQAQEEITRIFQFYLDTGITVGTPQWSSDGSQFISSAQLRYVIDPSDQSFQPIKFVGANLRNAYINVNDDLPYLGGSEFISVDATGNINRLSFLTTEYIPIESNWSWSPNESWVAFWLQFRLEDDKYADPQLAFLNVQTGEVIDTCLRGEGEPVWSPDSKQLAIHLYQEDEYSTDVILVDFEEGIAATIVRGASVGGWLVSPP